MEMANAAGIELAGKFRGYGGGDQLARRGKVIEPFEHVVEPRGYGRTARLGEATGGRDVRHREDAGHNLDIDAGRGGLILEAEEAVGGEKELGNGAVGAGVHLPPEILEVE